MWRKDVSGSTLALSRKKADCGELSLFGLKMLKKQNSAYAHMSAERQSIMSLSSVYGVFFLDNGDMIKDILPKRGHLKIKESF